MIEKGLATKVRFHVKAHPWFVTDVTERDFKWTLEYLSQHADYIISLIGKKFLQFLDEGKFELAPISHFWTSPHAFYWWVLRNCGFVNVTHVSLNLQHVSHGSRII